MAAAGGAIALVRDGDTIEISIPDRSIRLAITKEELARREAAEKRMASRPTALRRPARARSPTPSASTPTTSPPLTRARCGQMWISRPGPEEYWAVGILACS